MDAGRAERRARSKIGQNRLSSRKTSLARPWMSISGSRTPSAPTKSAASTFQRSQNDCVSPLRGRTKFPSNHGEDCHERGVSPRGLPREPQAIASAPYRRYVSGEQTAAVRHSGEHGDRLRKWRINERLSHVRVATLVCSYGLSRTDGSGVTFRARKGDFKRGNLWRIWSTRNL
jgi:hypothetical protein